MRFYTHTYIVAKDGNKAISIRLLPYGTFSELPKKIPNMNNIYILVSSHICIIKFLKEVFGFFNFQDVTRLDKCNSYIRVRICFNRLNENADSVFVNS